MSYQVMMHRRMRQLSLTETNTFVNLAKHALETLNASDDEDISGKDGVPAHYSDEANNSDDHSGDDADAAADVVSPTSLKTIQSEPVFKHRRKKRPGMLLGMGGMEEVDDEMEGGRWLGSPDGPDDDILHFVARSTSDIDLSKSEQRDDDDDAEPSGDETTHLAKNLLLC